MLSWLSGKMLDYNWDSIGSLPVDVNTFFGSNWQLCKKQFMRQMDYLNDIIEMHNQKEKNTQDEIQAFLC